MWMAVYEICYFEDYQLLSHKILESDRCVSYSMVAVHETLLFLSFWEPCLMKEHKHTVVSYNLALTHGLGYSTLVSQHKTLGPSTCPLPNIGQQFQILQIIARDKFYKLHPVYHIYHHVLIF